MLSSYVPKKDQSEPARVCKNKTKQQQAATRTKWSVRILLILYIWLPLRCYQLICAITAQLCKVNNQIKWSWFLKLIFISWLVHITESARDMFSQNKSNKKKKRISKSRSTCRIKHRIITNRWYLLCRFKTQTKQNGKKKKNSAK